MLHPFSESQLPRRSNCSKYRPPGHVNHAPGLTRSCCEVMTPQRHRHTGVVGSHLNYPRTEYDAPTGSSSRDRTGPKTHFESRRHADLAMFTNHT